MEFLVRRGPGRRSDPPHLRRGGPRRLKTFLRVEIAQLPYRIEL